MAAHYRASKGEVVLFTGVLALELAKHRINVNRIAPEFIQVEGEVSPLIEEYVATLTHQISWGRVGIPLDIANGAIFLVSSLVDYMTADVISINGRTSAGRAHLPLSTGVRPSWGVRMYWRLMPLALCFLLLGGCAAPTSGLSIAATGTNGAPEQIPATLMRPDGPGPFPAVVILHDCSGLGPRSSGAPNRWARELVRRGYVVVIPDSFTTRGHAGGVCTDPSPGRVEVSPVRRVRDAYAALAYIRTLPYVDGSRVGLMGGSHGGSTTLASMVAPENERELRVQGRRGGFAAAVALYPGCAARLGGWRVTRQAGATGPITDYIGVYKPVAPLLILIGENDDWTPAEPCRKLAEVAKKAGYPVAIKVYPGAHHSFDSNNPVRYVAARVNANSSSGRGATTGGDPTAWEDSIREVVAFFGLHLQDRKLDRIGS